MRIVLADLKGGEGFISKDTVAGGYGSRLRPFSKVTAIVASLKRHFHDLPSVHLAYAAAIAERAGHTVISSSGDVMPADVALLLSSLVDFRSEVAWARRMRAQGGRVGFIGLAASKMPQLFEDAADFIIDGEPEAAIIRLAHGERLDGTVKSPSISDLDSLPFPRWELLAGPRRHWRVPFAGRPIGGSLPVLASRSCPEFCTYCPHRILASYRSRSVGNILDELSQLADERGPVHVVFRDPLFTQERDRVLEMCDGILARALPHTFECETRLDRLDEELLDVMHRAGLRAMSFGVESVSPVTLRKAGRRPIPEAHQRAVLARCRRLGVVTAAFYVLGFNEDTWESISATIDYAIQLGSTVAQFKILTPYPATPLFAQMASQVTEGDWEKFDGFTPTFTHPHLSHEQMRFLLGAAYTRFYVRPSYLLNYLRVERPTMQKFAGSLDRRVALMHGRRELARMERVLSC